MLFTREPPFAHVSPQAPVRQDIPVTLTDSEMYEATEHGKRMHRESREDNREDKTGTTSDFICIIGAMGELAVAKVLGVPWEKHLNTFKAPDVGEFQVRARPQAYQELLFRPDDNPEEIYILVTRTRGSHFIVRGWQWGEVCRQEGPLRKLDTNRPPLHVLEQDRMEPTEELMDGGRWQHYRH